MRNCVCVYRRSLYIGVLFMCAGLSGAHLLTISYFNNVVGVVVGFAARFISLMIASRRMVCLSKPILLCEWYRLRSRHGSVAHNHVCMPIGVITTDSIVFGIITHTYMCVVCVMLYRICCVCFRLCRICSNYVSWCLRSLIHFSSGAHFQIEIEFCFVGWSFGELCLCAIRSFWTFRWYWMKALSFTCICYTYLSFYKNFPGSNDHLISSKTIYYFVESCNECTIKMRNSRYPARIRLTHIDTSLCGGCDWFPFRSTAIWTEWEAPIHSIQLKLRYNTIVLPSVYESHDIRLEWHIRWHRPTVCQIICANRFLPP